MQTFALAPEGKQRLRMRVKSVAYLFVKDAAGIRQFILLDEGANWKVGPETGRNLRK